MGIRTLVASLAGVVLASLTVAASPAAPGSAQRDADEPTALWDRDFRADLKAEDCGRWKLDDGFCTANDWRNGVELGTAFRTSRAVDVVGVRVYRVAPATLTGSLWDGAGNRIATGTFAPMSKKGWQDLVFAQPVAITPGQTYVASYYTPATKYAFQYEFFERATTRGPITALRATDSVPNGVHCYDVAPCTSPTDGFRSSSYWVSPLWQPSSDPTPPTPTTPTPTNPTPTPPTPAADQAPAVQAAAPSAGAKRVKRGASIKVTFSKKIRATTLTRATVRLSRKGRAARVPMSLTYDPRRARLTLKPKARLRAGTTYRVVVTSNVRDTAGNALDQDPRKPGIQPATWTFRTR